MKNEILMNSDDIIIRDLEKVECSECSKTATKQILIDIRSIGTSVYLGDFCSECARKIKKRIALSFSPL